MMYFNLLPWRILHRKQKQIYLLIALTGIIFGISFLSGVSRLVLQGKLNTLEQQIIKIKQQTIQVMPLVEQAQKIKSANKVMLIQLKFAKELKNDQKYLQNLLSTTSMVIPDNVYLMQIQYESPQIILTGNASTQSLAQLFLQRLQQAKLASSIALKNVEHRQQQEQFVLLLEQLSHHDDKA